MKYRYLVVLALFLLALLILFGRKTPMPIPTVVMGDKVTFHYWISHNGQQVDSTDGSRSIYSLRPTEPITITVGKTEFITAIDKALLGMAVGEYKSVKLKDAFGPYDPGNVITLPAFEPIEAEREVFNDELYAYTPIITVGEVIHHKDLYFPLDVLSVGEETAKVRTVYSVGTTLNYIHGPGRIILKSGLPFVEYISAIGDPWYGPPPGRIVERVGETMILDYNHPLAGQDLDIRIRVLQIQ